MDAHKRLQVSARGGIEMARHFCRILPTSVLVAALLVFFTAPRASAETYDAVNSHSVGFSTVSGTYHNDTQYIDAVYFGGREIIFFTLLSDYQASGKNQYLYFYTDSPSYNGKIDIGNSQDLNFRFKLVAVNDVLYVFYTTTCGIASSYGYSTSTIYYRTATVDYGATGQDWKLSFSGMKSFDAGVSPVKIRMAQMMNETIYVIYSAGDTLYSMSSPDGRNFGSKRNLFTASSIKGVGGAVFQVPDTTEGSVDKLMIAYATGSAVNDYFFDGENVYGPYTIDTLDLSPYSVRLFAGSAKDYSNSKYSIQVFITSPSNGSTTWHSIYHREYSPAGVNGDEGSWSHVESTKGWTALNRNGEDTVKTYDNDNSSDRFWAVIPFFTSDSTNPTDDIQMHLHIWACRGGSYYWSDAKDHVNLRRISYVSDLLVHQPTQTVGPERQDMSTETVIGVIEGPPPWPRNGGGGHNDTSNTSWVEFGQSATVTVDTTWSVGGSITGYVGQVFEKKGGWKIKFTPGVKYTHTSQTSSSASVGQVLKTYNDTVPGQLGWVVLLIPEIINDSYLLKAYDGNSLTYGNHPAGADEVTVSLITYGPNTRVNLKEYYLDNPSGAIGGDEINSSRKILEGMAARPLSDDWAGDGINSTGWLGVTSDYWKCQNLFGCPWVFKNLQTQNSQGQYIDLQLWSTGGESSSYLITYSTTEGETWSPSASFTASVDRLGFLALGLEVNVSFSMDMKTTSTMTGKLGFQYNIPDCCSPTANNNCEGISCYSATSVTPKILLPIDDSTGYSAPWISNDIRDKGKPKPWCLTYMVASQANSPAPDSNRLTVKDASARILLDRTESNRDKVSAKLTLQGVGPDIFEQLDKLVYLQLGSYVVNSDITPVFSKSVRGKKLVLEFRQGANPDSSIQVTFSYDKARSLLNIDLDAKGINLPDMVESLENAHEEGKAIAFPFGLFIGSRYYATKTLDTHITVNKENIICEIRGER